MNVATIGLPNWIPWPEDVATSRRLIAILTEHQLLVAGLDESRGEEEQLLRDYRDFLSSRDPALAAFFRFTTGYAGHALRNMSRRQRVRRLATDNLEEIIMAQEDQRTDKLKPVLDNVGFRNVATAIRLSTVTQQYYKTEQDDNTYEIRYGLADELHRRSRDNQEFMRAVGLFLKDYSQENARVMERNKDKKYRRRIAISTEDITQLTALVDQYGAATVASLLIAFGYARAARDTTENNGANTESDEASITTGETDSDDQNEERF